jgi:hypothetical protein
MGSEVNLDAPHLTLSKASEISEPQQCILTSVFGG